MANDIRKPILNGEAKHFTTDKKYYKTDKKGKIVLDEEGKPIELSTFVGIELKDMISWMNENATAEQKKAFKLAFHTDKNGEPLKAVEGKTKKNGEKGKGIASDKRTNFINAKNYFFETFAPELIPTKEPTGNDLMANW